MKKQGTDLFQGQADQIAAELRHLAKQKPAIPEEYLTKAVYFEKNKHNMKYMEMCEDGLVIGSGIVESGGKQFKAHFANPGMRWRPSGMERLLPDNAPILSERFDHFWKVLYTSPWF